MVVRFVCDCRLEDGTTISRGTLAQVNLYNDYTKRVIISIRDKSDWFNKTLSLSVEAIYFCTKEHRER